MTVQELKQEQAVWVAAATDEAERQAREWNTLYLDVEADRRTARWDMEAYDAVRRGVPVYVAALDADDPAVRLYAAHLLAWFPEESDVVVPALTLLIAEEWDPIVASTACVAAGLCGATDSDTALVEAVSASGPARTAPSGGPPLSGSPGSHHDRRARSSRTCTPACWRLSSRCRIGRSSVATCRAWQRSPWHG
ncbi:hypothetical protein [Polymorphospora rubra]|uniref:hypothetical protein n=1 Tax=Polymorphospora rubra TaxID=338584 RepID=UPI0033E20D82